MPEHHAAAVSGKEGERRSREGSGANKISTTIYSGLDGSFFTISCIVREFLQQNHPKAPWIAGLTRWEPGRLQDFNWFQNFFTHFQSWNDVWNFRARR